MTAYRTIASECREEPAKTLGSRHIGTAVPVVDAKGALEVVTRIKAEMHDARHHAWAFRIGRGGEEFRYSDDGEPSGSAGQPILRQIDGHGVTFVVVVVTRYFGGTKLGVGGLVRAYGGAAAAVLDAAEIVEVVPTRRVVVEYGYELSSAVQKILAATGLVPADADYGEGISMEFDVPEDDVEGFVDRLVDATANRARIRVD